MKNRLIAPTSRARPRGNRTADNGFRKAAEVANLQKRAVQKVKKTNSDAGGSSNENKPESMGSSSKIEGNPPNGAISKSLRFGKIDEDRNSTGESVDFKDTFKVGNYNDKKNGNPEVSGVWSAFDFSDSGYTPESDVTVIVRLEFENDEKKCIDVAYDAKSDKNGCVKIDRVSIINLDGSKINSTVNTDTDLKIRMKISSVEGRPKEVFGQDNIVKNSLPSTDIRYYAQAHASSEKKSNYAQRDRGGWWSYKELCKKT